MQFLFWIASLILLLSQCLNGSPTQIRTKRSTQDIDFELLRSIDHLQNLKCEDEAKFYTPYGVTDDCVVAALNCSAEELNTMISQCPTDSDNIDPVVDLLRTKINNTKIGTDSSECICEKSTEERLEPFLKNLKYLVERLNSRAHLHI